MILAQLHREKKNLNIDKVKKEILDAGFIRFTVNGEETNINSEIKIDEKKSYDIDIVVDRLVVKDFSDIESADTKRLKDSLDLAFQIGKGHISISCV